MADNDNEKMTAELFGELMNQFYDLGWMFGSSGGMAVVEGDLAYYSPSSVQKERLSGMDLFVFNVSNNTLSSRPQNAAIKESACTPLFSHILNQDLKCVIHTHSKYSNLITQLLTGSDILRISHQEMIKGVINRKTGKAHDYNDTIQIPIIENEPFEHLLLPALARTLNSHPEASGILVRNHGFFAFGPTWQRTKIMTECYEYLFSLGCDMHHHNLPLHK